MTNKLIVPEVEFAINQLKEEIAAELGIEINADMKSRDAGRIGGEITKRLIELGKNSLLEQGINPTINTQYMYNQTSTPQNQLH
jgi:small acid-soluble spore protein A (major alpha-type SASP)